MSVLLKNCPDCASGISTTEACYNNIDLQAACLTNYDQEYLQLSPGQYNGWFKTVLLGSEVGLYFEYFDQELDQWGACPKGQHGFIFLMENSADIVFNGSPFDKDCIMYMAPGSVFDSRAGSGTKFGVISVSDRAFQLFFTACELIEERCNDQMPTALLIRSATRAQTLREMTHQGVQMAIDFSSASLISGALVGLQTSLISLLTSIVSSAFREDFGRYDESAELRSRPAFQAREFLHTTGAANTSVVDLVHLLGTSRRKLEYDFQRHYGVGPAEYIRLVKLNNFRSALLNDANRDQSIGDIAAHFGIWHLGRLAQNYRRQFGELPSQTRRGVEISRGGKITGSSGTIRSPA